MKVRKEVSLCLNTAQVAQRMDNFSAFVRQALIDYDEGYTVEYLRAECARFSALLDDIREGRKAWENGYGWKVIE